MTTHPHKASHTAQAAAGSVPPTNTAEPAANLISPPIPAGGELEAAPISPHGAASPALSSDLVVMVAKAIARQLTASMEETKDGVLFEVMGINAAAVAAIQAVTEAQWRPIEAAKKDGTPIWAKLRDDIYPGLLPSRDDLKRWNGIHLPLRHQGLGSDGFDIGWGVAAPVGCGGFPDEWIAGWMPLPAPPKSEESEHG